MHQILLVEELWDTIAADESKIPVPDSHLRELDRRINRHSSNLVAETKEISENVYVDLDANGNLVSMTIEHARQNANLPEVAYEAMAQTA